jgi:hypothetical protein
MITIRQSIEEIRKMLFTECSLFIVSVKLMKEIASNIESVWAIKRDEQ